MTVDWQEVWMITGVLLIVPLWRIFVKAGFPGWFSLFVIVPGLNLVVLCYVAFADWPLHYELSRLRQGMGKHFF